MSFIKQILSKLLIIDLLGIIIRKNSRYNHYNRIYLLIMLSSFQIDYYNTQLRHFGWVWKCVGSAGKQGKKAFEAGVYFRCTST